MKECSRCQLTKGNAEFDKSRSIKSGLQAWCRDCKVFKQRVYHKKYYMKNRVSKIVASREYSRLIRKTLVEGYGGKCECCGDDHMEFMAIDHMHGGGRAEVKKLGGARQFYRYLIKNGFPKDKYRLLCHNCNQSRGSWGYCPHAGIVKGD